MDSKDHAELSSKPGLAGAYMLEPAARPPMTKEQEIRGKDVDIPCVQLVTGYGASALSRMIRGSYRLDFLLGSKPAG